MDFVAERRNVRILKVEACLAERGWQVCDATDFLELTPEETAYLELELVLSGHLKAQRQAVAL
jgi:hypothetical protein